MRFFLVLLLSVAFISPSSSFAQEASMPTAAPSIDPNSRLATYGKYLVLRNEGEETYVITGDGAWTVYESPEVDIETTEPLGFIRPIGALDSSELNTLGDLSEIHYVFTRHIPGKKSFFGGQEMSIENTPLHSVSIKGKLALPLNDARGDWLRTQVGWVHRSEPWQAVTKLLHWKRVYEDQLDYEKFVYPEERRYDDVVPLGTLNEMRDNTSYELLGDVTIYTSASSDSPVTKITSPLHLAVVEIQGTWLKVFAAQPRCNFGGTSADYREGTIGWVSLFDENGTPQIMRNKQPCG